MCVFIQRRPFSVNINVNHLYSFSRTLRDQCFIILIWRFIGLQRRQSRNPTPFFNPTTVFLPLTFVLARGLLHCYPLRQRLFWLCSLPLILLLLFLFLRCLSLKPGAWNENYRLPISKFWSRIMRYGLLCLYSFLRLDELLAGFGSLVSISFLYKLYYLGPGPDCSFLSVFYIRAVRARADLGRGSA